MLARLTLPNESRIPLLAGYIDRRQGRWEKSLEEMNQALELDPRNFSDTPANLSYLPSLASLQRVAATLDSVLAIAPKDVASRVRRALVDAEGRADLNLCIRRLRRFWPKTRTPRFALLIHGSFLPCARAIPRRSSAR